MKSREESIELLNKYIKNENLRRHCHMVATAMEAYAEKLEKSKDEVEKWWCTGLLHDLDWEQFPDDHPKMAVEKILPDAGFDEEEILEAIKAHAPDRMNKQPETELERYLFACDEISGFIHACSLVRPEGLKDMKVKSVKKRLKAPKFAAGVSRDDIQRGIELIDSSIEEHVAFLIKVFDGKMLEIEEQL